MSENPKKFAAMILDDKVGDLSVRYLVEDLLEMKVDVLVGRHKIESIEKLKMEGQLGAAREVVEAVDWVESVLMSDPDLCLVLFVDGSFDRCEASDGKWVCEGMKQEKFAGRVVTVNFSSSDPQRTQMGADIEMFGKLRKTSLEDVMSIARQRLSMG